MPCRASASFALKRPSSFGTHLLLTPPVVAPKGGPANLRRARQTLICGILACRVGTSDRFGGHALDGPDVSAAPALPDRKPDREKNAVMAAEKTNTNRKTVAENRRARYEFAVGDVFEAGLQLTGTEVKSLRSGKANIAESYASVENGGIFLINAHIPEYRQAGAFFQHDPRRPRRLLLHKSEIAKLAQAVERQGMTMVPLELYFNDRGIAKLKIAVAQGKKLHDKRDTERKRDWQREKSRLLKERG